MSVESSIVALRMVLQELRDTNLKLMGGLPDPNSFEQRQLEEALGRWSRVLEGARRAERAAHSKARLLSVQVPRSGGHSPARDRAKSADLIAHELTHTVQQLAKQLATLDKRIRGIGSVQRELEALSGIADAINTKISDSGKQSPVLHKGSPVTQATVQQMQYELPTGSKPTLGTGFDAFLYMLVFLATLRTHLRSRK